ncbi:hypothetical protein E8L90_03325 [Brevibacillus antibioticus]|uniref:Uncharacterized protein n=1 Tax=Brevibacillus antibioticus TaxID=2570228 RepID=A0A4U2Y299_9BACL|nr:hypothetical protein [Brevibacillus antibioticus]TKI54549.1 hypothetical protein E8L90_03325 [Brevibacillus antibioticus]
MKVEIEKQNSPFDEYYYVYREDDPEDAYIFLSDTELTDWLEQKYHDWGYWECKDLESYMDDIKVWQLIPKSTVERWPTLYRSAKSTSIVVDDEQYYRKTKGINPEFTITISLS